MELQRGMKVEHVDFGVGTVESVLGSLATVSFLGQRISVSTIELQSLQRYKPDVVVDPKGATAPEGKWKFRRSFEAINLGVVPPDPQQLIDLTIGKARMHAQVLAWLRGASTAGLCKVVSGYYGSGKTHYLNFVKTSALQQGWVVSFVEFDPKEADPAKPHLIYREVMAGLEFPEREDGRRNSGYFDLVAEIRMAWYAKSLRDLKWLRHSPWFSGAFEILNRVSHSELDIGYKAVCNWLFGDYKALPVVNEMRRNTGSRLTVPRMPLTKESSDIYVFHLIVLAELCRTLGYRGLLLILDEAEHVRGYSVKRFERATNLFDILSRCANPPAIDLPNPFGNDHGIPLPQYWLEGPHFGLVVGLTDDGSLENPQPPLRDACVFLHRAQDLVRLEKPSQEEIRRWSCDFFRLFGDYYPLVSRCIGDVRSRETIVNRLLAQYESARADTMTLRNWTKLVGLVPCAAMAKGIDDAAIMADLISRAAEELTGNRLPWED